MVADRLASILRSLSASGSRRTILGVVLGGPVVLQRLTQAESSSTKKRKKNPCTHQPNDASCKGTGRCLSGVCNSQPACLPYTAICTSPQSCCGQFCFSEPGGPGECTGGEVGVGGACQVNKDCASGLGCLGYVCQSTSCGPAGDACVDQTLVCGIRGSCLRPVGGGDSRCGAFPPTTSCGCTSNRQCSQRLGPGAFCATFTRNRETFCFCEGKSSFCAIPA